MLLLDSDSDSDFDSDSDDISYETKREDSMPELREDSSSSASCTPFANRDWASINLNTSQASKNTTFSTTIGQNEISNATQYTPIFQEQTGPQTSTQTTTNMKIPQVDGGDDLQDNDINILLNQFEEEEMIEPESNFNFNYQHLLNNINYVVLSEQNKAKRNPITSIDNNLTFKLDVNGLGKEYISGSSCYPPRLNSDYTLGAYNTDNNTCTIKSIENGNIQNVNTDNSIYVEINTGEVYQSDWLYRDGKHTVTPAEFNNICTINGHNNIELINEELNEIVRGDKNNKEVIIQNKTIKWYIKVPIVTESGNIEYINLFADPGANHGCINTAFAVKHFSSFIRRNSRNSTLYTPGGPVVPKYVLWLTFPAKSGKIFKARMYLVDELPVDILADINMLKAFGYVFKDEIPPEFEHKPKEPIDFQLRDQEDQFKITKRPYHDDFKKFKGQKLGYSSNVFNQITDIPRDRHQFLESNGKILYSEKHGSHILQQPAENVPQIPKVRVETQSLTENEINIHYNYLMEDQKQREQILNTIDYDPNDYCLTNYMNITTYEDYENFDINKRETLKKAPYQQELGPSKLETINKTLGLINQEDKHTPVFVDPQIDRFGASTSKAPIWHRCMFIVAKQAFMATDQEKAKAESIFVNEELKFNDYSYLKQYEAVYGARFKGLYVGITSLIKEFQDIFAKRQFDRRTMKVKPARLGIKAEHRDKTMFAGQYPINAIKRLHMINYTIVNQKNGFWKRIDYSLHCVPYTMVPKKRHGVIYRYRPAFDGRPVNQYCELMPSNMPTLKDFDDLHSIRGFTTCADVKNCFDCIPLDPRDWKYAVCMTPLGLYQMMCMTYGWMNAAPCAQYIMNKLALYVGNTLAYIDDINIKHPFEGGTKEIVSSIRRLFEYCRAKNIQLHPSKFFPVCTKSEGFAFIRTLDGSYVGEPYTKKVLSIIKPRTKSELDHFKGVIGYIGRYIYHKAHLLYWLTDLDNHIDGKGKLKWTPQANLAYEQLIFLVQNSPLLYNPTREGKFCVKTDACNYGIGAVLYQQQLNKKTNQLEWRIVDMWSKVMPQALRHCHSMVHEAYALVHAMEHWQFYLIKRKFTISTDNNPVANIFTHKYRSINAITQTQLLRLRNKVNMFHFEAKHVKGLDNALADSLSRFTTELLNKDKQGRIFRPIHSVDTSNKQLTKEEHDSIQGYLKTSEQLRKKHDHLKSRKGFHISNVILNTGDDNLQQYRKLQSYNNATWDNSLHNYRITGALGEQAQLAMLLDNATDECINSDESEFISNTYYGFQELMYNFTDKLHKVSIPVLNCIHSTTQEYINSIENIIKEKNLSKPTTNSTITTAHHVNVNDEIYDPTIDEANIPSSEQPAPLSNRVQTRSRSKQQTNNNDNDDPYDFINIDFRDTRTKSMTRDELLTHLFGYRSGLDIFQLENFRLYQQTDSLLKLVRKAMTNPAYPKRDEDIQFIKAEDPHLMSKWSLGQLRINQDNQLIQATAYDYVTQQNIWVNVVPFNIRGKLMDYAHHNLQLHHYSYKYTLDYLERRYWWGTMKNDVRSFCDTCFLCQFTKGSVRHRAPLRIRSLPKPREHIFCDFLGPIFGQYHILVIIDYATGYTMLIPTTGTNSQTIIQAFLKHWIPVFGWFKILETDWGSGFTSKLIQALTRAAKIKISIAEPRNHRSIGKVERTIGFVQQTLNQYNQLLDQQFTANVHEFAYSWEIIETLLPFIQMGINQHRSRFTGVSPNMLTLGSNVRDASDLGNLHEQLQDASKQLKLSTEDYGYVKEIFDTIVKLNEIYKNDWKSSCWVSRLNYNTKWRITNKKINNYRRQFKKDTKVLYFIGDKADVQGKWRRKWSGPWTVDKHLNDSTLIIGDPETGNQKRVSFDRIRKFNDKDYGRYTTYFTDEDMYTAYYDRQLDTLTNYSVKVRNQDVNLDYSQPAILNQ